MIGISGARGTIGGSLTPLVVTRLADAFAVFLKRQKKSTHPASLLSPSPGSPGEGRGEGLPSHTDVQPQRRGSVKVVIGRDSRPSGLWVRDAAVSSLIANGVEVIDLDIVTTPGVAIMVRHLGADAGIVATASHNPIEWNGLKFLNRDAVAPPPVDAR